MSQKRSKNSLFSSIRRWGVGLTLLAFLVYGFSPQPGLAAGSRRPNRQGAADIFVDSGQALGNAQSSKVALGDLDSDGDIDAFMVNWANQPAEVWFNGRCCTLEWLAREGVSQSVSGAALKPASKPNRNPVFGLNSGQSRAYAPEKPGFLPDHDLVRSYRGKILLNGQECDG